MDQHYCPVCKKNYNEFCDECLQYLRRQINRHPVSKMAGTDKIDEIRRWRPCHRRLPVPAQLWAQRMSELLGRDVGQSEWQRISELVGEIYAKNPKPA